MGIRGRVSTRADTFLELLQAVATAQGLIEDLEDGMFGYQRRELVTARVSIRQAKTRLIALASLTSRPAA